MQNMEMAEKRCTLSIIVTVYNMSEWLEECLDSILAQTWEDFELICVDDGSTDNSLEILHRYLAQDQRIRVIHKENGGLVSAKKAGVQQAKGLYVGWVDADDWIDSQLFECLMKKAVEYDADVVTSGCIREYGSASVIQREGAKKGLYEGESILQEFLPNLISVDDFFSQSVYSFIVAKVYKTELYKKYQMLVPDQIRIGEDQACTLPILLNASRIYVLGEEMYHYRQRENSTCGSENRSIETYKPAMLHMAKYFQNAGYPESREQFSRVALYTMLFMAPEQVWQYKESVPFSNLPKGKVLLYGMGKFGKSLAAALQRKDGIQVVGYLDKAPRILKDGLPSWSLQELKNIKIEYDYIIVSALQAYACKEIQQELLASGIPEEKIISPCVKNAQEIVAKILNEK